MKRIYEPPARDDGQRVLVDRIWPRGIRKDDARLDAWLRDVAPSTRLRQWFGHRPDRWDQFRRRYREELVGNPALDELRTMARHGHVTLLYGARDPDHNQAHVLAELLNHR